MSEPAQKCFKPNYTLELFVAFKTAYSCCFALRGDLDLPDFLQKSFITSTTGKPPVIEFTFTFPNFCKGFIRQVDFIQIIGIPGDEAYLPTHGFHKRSIWW